MAEYRVNELSSRSGVSSRNIRAYRERGLLDPPRREGRSAYYDDRHLAQLSVINELLRKGFTTAHISEFLSSARQGHDLADILGLQQAIFGPPRQTAAVAVDIDPTSNEAHRLVEYGLAEIAEGKVTLSNPDIAEVVGRTEAQLAYVRTILRVADGIGDVLDLVAGAVVQALEESLAARYGTKYVPQPDDMAELRRVVTDYRALGSHVVADRLEDALQRHLVSAMSDYTVGIVTGGQWSSTAR